MKKNRYEKARIILIVQTAFIGMGALGGAIAMFIDPTGQSTGMAGLLPGLNKLPFADVLFKNLVFSGISLLIVNGLSNLTAMFLLLERKHIGVKLGFAFGITLMLWICIQFYIVPPNFMSSIYFVFGAAQAATGYAAWVFCCQVHFCVSEKEYPNIGKAPDRLVVYFSRMGYTKKAALEEAERTGACVFEVRSTERTEGTLGFWWCGRYGMHAWDMPIAGIPSDLEAYSRVTVCSPIWVFGLSAPMRTFCRAARGKIKEADYILVHHQKNSYFGAAEEMDRLLGLENSPTVSICCRRGNYTKSVSRVPRT